MNCNRKKDSLYIFFDTSNIKQDSSILDPYNIATVADYYLLENLSAGLLRDSIKYENGYEPVLSERWYQKNSSSWTFVLRRDNRWSDGAKISGDQFIEYYNFLSKVNSRHIIYLKHLKKITYSKESRELSFLFDRMVGNALLHEMSLADAVLLHPSNRSGSWEVTSGPYTVKDYSINQKRLKLKINEYSVLNRGSSPKSVLLTTPLIRDYKKGYLQTNKIDLFPLAAFSFVSKYKDIIETADAVVTGYPTYVYYFRFNFDYPLANDPDIRKEFAYIINKSLNDKQLVERLKYENQFIPIGYSGRLKEYIRKEVAVKKLRGKHIIVSVGSIIEEFKPIINSIRAIAESLDVKIDFQAESNFGTLKANSFATISSFKGNQKDPIGGWQFIFTTQLQPFFKRVEPLFQRIIGENDESKRRKLLEAFHKSMLDNVYLVPFAMESPVILTSQYVNIENWNPFDMRWRFYDVSVR